MHVAKSGIWIITARHSTSLDPSTTFWRKCYYPHITDKETEAQVRHPIAGQLAGIYSRHRIYTCFIPSPVLSPLHRAVSSNYQATGWLVNTGKKGLSIPSETSRERARNCIPWNMWKQKWELGLNLDGWCSNTQFSLLLLIIWKERVRELVWSADFLKEMSCDWWLRKDRGEGGL